MKYKRRFTAVNAIEIGYHYPDGSDNEWFMDAVTRNAIITHNMGKFHNPNLPPKIEVVTRDGVEIGEKGDFIMLDTIGNIHAIKRCQFLANYEAV